MTKTNWLWVGTIDMLAGSVVLFLMGGNRTRHEEDHTIVPLFAAISYFAMAVHQGQVTLEGGRVVLFRATSIGA